MAGATVHGVDKVARPNYCGESFTQMDAIYALLELKSAGDLAGTGRPDLVHASCPCQAGCTLTNGTNKANGWGAEHDQLVPETRRLLDLIGIPYVLEQPTGHGGLIRTDLRLCMDMHEMRGPIFPPWVQRHRDFEFGNWPDLRQFGYAESLPAQPKHRKHRGYVRGMRHGVLRDGPYVAAYGSGGGKATVVEMQHALGIDWTSEREELTEAIPPAYTAYIGAIFSNSLGRITMPAPDLPVL